jgi:hypothetical protein
VNIRVVNFAVAGGLGAVVAPLLAMATAAADPPPEVPVVDPMPPPAPPSYLGALRSAPLAQSNDPAPGIAGLPDLSAVGGQLLLGQTSTPALPGTDPSVLPNPNPLNNSYLLPQNVVPSAPGEGQIVGVEAGQGNADIKRRDYLRRLWASYQAGGLDGALLGQRPRSELDQPLPPPPG